MPRSSRNPGDSCDPPENVVHVPREVRPRRWGQHPLPLPSPWQFTKCCPSAFSWKPAGITSCAYRCSTWGQRDWMVAFLKSPGQEVVEWLSFQHVFTEHLLCARHWAQCWEHGVAPDGCAPCPCGAHVRDTDSKWENTHLCHLYL